MLQIGVGEFQKNLSILTTMTEAIEIVDKRRRKKIAVIYPSHEQHITATLAGKYRSRVAPVRDLEAAKEAAMMEAMEEKYGQPR